MVRTLLVRGMLVGLVAGLFGFAVAKTVGEAPLGRAIGYETAHEAPLPPGTPARPEMVSRTAQSTIGLLIGTVLVGISLGGVFALGFAYARGRIGTTDARAASALVGVIGFVVLFLAPFVVYPSNPPAANDPDTIGHRSQLYFVMVALSCLSGVGALMLRSTLLHRLGGWDATIAATAAFVAVVAALAVGLPGVNEIPADFPAAVVWRFRLASVGIQGAIWTTLGLGFGWWTARVERAGGAAVSLGRAAPLQQ